MAEAKSPQPQTSTSSTAPGQSPPPNCAICLGKCINKCFSDSCMHQFCFKCLLEWSKVKAVCPLCKQPFKSIIHNVKSNDEYEEHFIASNSPNEHLWSGDEFVDRRQLDFYLPTPRHFQFRTTLTVDPRGELAIQQLLSSHPLTNSVFENASHSSHQHRRCLRNRRDVSSTSYRRFVYDNNLWVNALPDITGRFREVRPQFFLENPAARNRLVPWLNRELNALLHENTQHVMFVVDVILSQLDRHHLLGRFFRQLLQEYLGDRTDHFIHEFYNFMRSPYDMIGYDRHVFFTTISQTPYVDLIDDDSDSDVAVVSVTLNNNNNNNNNNVSNNNNVIVNNNPAEPDVIEIDSDSGSDVIIQEPPPPDVVDLLDSDSNDSNEVRSKPVLPLKIRLKQKRKYKQRKSSKRFKRSESATSSSSSSESSSSTSTATSSSSTSTTLRKHFEQIERRKLRHKKYKRYKESSSEDDTSCSEQTVTNVNKTKKLKDRKYYEAMTKRKEMSFKLERDNKSSSDEEDEEQEQDRSTMIMTKQEKSEPSSSYTPPPQSQPTNSQAGPSRPNPNFINKVAINNWFSRPVVFSSSSSSSWISD